MKLIMSLSQISFFVFVAQFLSTVSSPEVDLITYIAIGNAMSVLSWNTIFSVVNITSHDKWDGTLPLVLATPAHRLPLFIGRAMIHVFDGMLSVLIGFAYSAFLFGVDFGNTDVLALLIVVALTAFAMAGFGLLIGGLSFYYRDPLIFANIFTFALLIFCGVNFPIQELPHPLHMISYIFPLTYGVDAGRRIIAGAALIYVISLLSQMLIVGFISITLGYIFFRSFEHLARKTGRIEAI
ncbi:MAG: ABC transporter permease [Candidatus Bathyarchaeota archaeon]|nr:MAG: ABC transporter permease [Candidatus Bathyarchaeota archaeon]